MFPSHDIMYNNPVNIYTHSRTLLPSDNATYRIRSGVESIVVEWLIAGCSVHPGSGGMVLDCREDPVLVDTVTVRSSWVSGS